MIAKVRKKEIAFEPVRVDSGRCQRARDTLRVSFIRKTCQEFLESREPSSSEEVIADAPTRSSLDNARATDVEDAYLKLASERVLWHEGAFVKSPDCDFSKS